MDPDQLMDELWSIFYSQLNPALENLMMSAQQLDVTSIIDKMPTILQQGVGCKFSPEQVENYSSSTGNLTTSLKSLTADQLAVLGLDQLGTVGSLFALFELGYASVYELEYALAMAKETHAMQLVAKHDRAQLPSLADLQHSLENVELPSMDSLQLPSMGSLQLPSLEEVELPTVQGLTNFISSPDSPVLYALRNGTICTQ
jgi:hypothetical protein